MKYFMGGPEENDENEVDPQDQDAAEVDAETDEDENDDDDDSGDDDLSLLDDMETTPAEKPAAEPVEK